MSEIKNLDILEDLYLQYNDMEVAMEKWLNLYQLKIVRKYEYTSMENLLTYSVRRILDEGLYDEIYDNQSEK